MVKSPREKTFFSSYFHFTIPAAQSGEFGSGGSAVFTATCGKSENFVCTAISDNGLSMEITKEVLVLQRDYWCKWAKVFPPIGCPWHCAHREQHEDDFERWAKEGEEDNFHRPRKVDEETLFLSFFLDRKLGDKCLDREKGGDDREGGIVERVIELADECPRLEKRVRKKTGGISKARVRQLIARLRIDRGGPLIPIIEYRPASYKPMTELEAYVSVKDIFGPVRTFEKMEQEITELIGQGQTLDNKTSRYLQRKYSMSKGDVEHIWRSREEELKAESPRSCAAQGRP
jgi:hypothetical protein